MPVSQAANSETFKVTTPSDCEIRLTRLFDAPRESRLRGHDQARARQAVVGCHQRQALGDGVRDRSPARRRLALRRQRSEGAYPAFYGTYSEIVPPERLVFTEFFEPHPGEGSTVTTVLTEENGKTRFTMTATYSSSAVRDMVLGTGMEKGAAKSYDRLEEVAAKLQKRG